MLQKQQRVTVFDPQVRAEEVEEAPLQLARRRTLLVRICVSVRHILQHLTALRLWTLVLATNWNSISPTQHPTPSSSEVGEEEEEEGEGVVPVAARSPLRPWDHR